MIDRFDRRHLEDRLLNMLLKFGSTVCVRVVC